MSEVPLKPLSSGNKYFSFLSRHARKGVWYLITEQPAPSLHLAHAEGCAALRIVLVTVPRVRKYFLDGLDLHLPPALESWGSGSTELKAWGLCHPSGLGSQISGFRAHG